MATESGGDEIGGPGTRPATRRRRRLVTNETAATGGIMCADEGSYTIDVSHVEELVGTTREAADGDETGDKTGGPGDETSDKNVATAGDERDGGECKEGSVHLTLTTIFCRCQQTVQLPPVPKPIQL